MFDYYTKLRLPFVNALPKNWMFVKIGELFAESKVNNREDLPLLSVTRERGIIPQSESEKRDVSSVDKSKYKVIEPGDIVYNTMRMWQGVVSLSNREGIVSPAYTVLKPKRVVDGKFVEYLFRSSAMIKLFHRFSQGLVDDTLNLKYDNIREILMPLPPLAVQQEIAEILSSVDEAIVKTEAIIKQTETVKKGLVQQLLTKGIGLTEFKETEIGNVPIYWDMMKLNDINPLKKEVLKTGPFGSSLKTEHFQDNGVPVINIFNLGEAGLMTDSLYYISEEKACDLRNYQVLENDILFSRVADIGRSVVVPRVAEGWVMSSNLMRIRIKNINVLPEYLYYQIVFGDLVLRQLTSATNNAGRPTVNSKILNDLWFPIPPIPEQMKILEILTSFKNKLKSERDKIIYLVRIKESLMQSLLTGKLRLILGKTEEVLV